MNCFRLLAAAALTCGMPILLPVSATAAEDAAPSADLRAKAASLAAILGSAEMAIGNVAQQRAGVISMWQQLDEMAALEAQSPGTLDALADAIFPLVIRDMRTRVPELQRQYADFYARTFTAAELDTLIAFYASSTGRKLMTGLQDNITFDALGRDFAQNGMESISAEAALADIAASAPAAMRNMTAEDFAALGRFGNTSAAVKLKTASVRSQRIFLDWSVASSPGVQEEANEIIAGVLAERIGAGSE